MDIFYQFDDDIRTAHVLVPWMIAKDLKPGTPLTETGEVANDDTAYGLLINAGDVGEGVVVKETGAPPLAGPTLCVNCEVMIAGYCDEKTAEASCGLTYTDALKSALSDIVFVDGVIGGGGGGSETTKTYYVPEQTVTLTSFGSYSAYILSNVTLDGTNGTPPSLTLSVDENTETLVFDDSDEVWSGDSYAIDHSDGMWRLYPNGLEPLSSVTVSAYVEESGGGSSGGGGGAVYIEFSDDPFGGVHGFVGGNDPDNEFTAIDAVSALEGGAIIIGKYYSGERWVFLPLAYEGEEDITLSNGDMSITGYKANGAWGMEMS